ncbi:anaerobic ribonucleoside-triphosphate reductase-activating protein [Morganella phage vB_Mm5]
MNYQKLITMDVLNGTGFRTVLFVSGCNHKCDGCYNKDTWNPRNGEPFTDDVMNTLMSMLSDPSIDGLTLTGGDPLYKDNLVTVLNIVTEVKYRFPDKNIWLWSGFTYDDALQDPIKKEILSFVDVFVDGRYEKNNKTKKPFRGSDNQNLIRLKENSIDIITIE